MKEIDRLNYLHYGDAFDRLKNADLPSLGSFKKEELVLSIANGYSPSEFLRAVVTSYSGSRSRQVDLANLAADLKYTCRMRHLFNVLGCRGFSYSFVNGMTGFPYRLRQEVDLRVALVTSCELFYPPHVRKYLPRHSVNHYDFYEAPAIAFALGMKKAKTWYVFIMQSDLTRRVPACVREHFRGWRKVLFANIVRFSTHLAERVYLCSEVDVFNGCHPGYRKPTEIPKIWESIYRGTARDFGMVETRLKRPINIQLYDRQPPVYARTMYCLDINHRSRPFSSAYNGENL